ncbi:MAG: DUF885 family protein [Phycisphaeraceae bacterium]|nr:DUF885 family protein [Phycisphaeraceae bacterium]MCW5763167.1 DUF885 family protein [Phycisphaeraceae bacterium]
MMTAVRTALAAAVWMLAILSSSAPAQPMTPDSVLAPAIRALDADERTIARFHDDRWSRESIEARTALAQRALAAWPPMPFDDLDVTARADALMLRAHLVGTLADLELAAARRAEMLPLLPHRDLIEDLEALRTQMAELDLPSLARELAALPQMLRLVRERITSAAETENPDAISVTPSLALRAAGASAASRRTLERFRDHYAAFVPAFGWHMDAPIREALAAIGEHEKFLRESIAGQGGGDADALVGDPIGSEALLAHLEREMIALSPEELIAVAETELAWCRARLAEAAGELGYGGDIAAAIDHVKSLHVAPGEQPALVTRLAREAIDFVRERNLVTVPELCADLWRTQMISARDQRTWPFAAYNNNHVMVAYASSEQDFEARQMAMRGNNEHFTRLVVQHELIPGHHLQGFMAARHRAYRSLFATPFFVEGWALYWEMLLWDVGFARGPEDRIGMLFWRSHRAARIIVSLKFHLGQMTPAEMTAFLVDQIHHERDNAASEVRRYVGEQYSPLYQVAYMIGGLQLRALAREVEAAGTMSQLEFHDELLRHGSIPVAMIRAQILGHDLSPAFTPDWRFDRD